MDIPEKSTAGIGELPCGDCGAPNPVWFAPNADWNLVMGGPEAKGDPGGYICPNCYIRRAEVVGICRTAWIVSREDFGSEP